MSEEREAQEARQLLEWFIADAQNPQVPKGVRLHMLRAIGWIRDASERDLLRPRTRFVYRDTNGAADA